VIGSLWVTIGGKQIFVTESCVFGPGFYCSDFVVSETSITIKIKNSMGKNIEEFNINYPGCSASPSVSFDNGVLDSFIIADCNFSVNEVFEDSIEVNYKFEESSISHTKSASIIGIIQGETIVSSGSDENTNLLCKFENNLTCIAGVNSVDVNYTEESGTLFVDGFNESSGAVLVEENDKLAYSSDILNLSRGTAEAQINFVNGSICTGTCYIFSHIGTPSSGNKNSLTLYKYNTHWAFYISDGGSNSQNILYSYSHLEGWHHFAAVWDKDIDGGYVDFFIDGVKQVNVFGLNKNIAHNFPSGVNKLGVGYRDTVSNSGLGLAIDEFKVSDIVRYS
jgi:hypothetical protein